MAGVVLTRSDCRRMTKSGVASILVLSLMGCTARPTPCLAPRDCERGFECLASRCLPRHAEPIPSTGERLVLYPVRVATDEGSVSGSSVTIGGERGAAPLYVAFAPIDARSGVSAAFLTLHPATPNAPSASEARVTVTPLLDAWEAGPPRHSTRSASGLARGDRAIIVDLTALYRDERPNAFAVETTSSLGLVSSLGTSNAKSPRLELYLAPEGRP